MYSGALVKCLQAAQSGGGSGRRRVFANFHVYFIESGVGKQGAPLGTSQILCLTAISYKYALSTTMSCTDMSKS